MIVKRALNTFRNPGVLVSQLVLPLVFVTLGLTFLKTLPSWLANDPPRQLTLKESSPYTGIKMFYADFEDTSPGPNDILKVNNSRLYVLFTLGRDIAISLNQSLIHVATLMCVSLA